jgi:hypothetical protein
MACIYVQDLKYSKQSGKQLDMSLEAPVSTNRFKNWMAILVETKVKSLSLDYGEISIG